MERDEVTISAYKLALRESQSANLTKDATIADLERRLAEARRDSERLTHMIDRSNAGFSWLHERVWEQAAQLCPLDADEAEDVQKWVRAVIDADIAARKEGA